MTPRTKPIVQAINKAFYDPWSIFDGSEEGEEIWLGGSVSCATPEKDDAYLDMLNQELNDAKGG